MRRGWQHAALAVLAAVAGWLAWRGSHREVLDQAAAVARARAVLGELGGEAAGEATVRLRGEPLLAWAWERAWAERGAVAVLPSVFTVSFREGGEVGFRGSQLVELRRPLPADPGENLPAYLLEPHLRRKLKGIVADLASFSLANVALREEGGLRWKRARFSKELAGGWGEELVVEVAGSAVVALRRTLVPEASDMGLVVGRVSELVRARWLALLALGLALAGLLVSCLEGFYVRLRLPWGKAAMVGLAVFFLGSALRHGQLATMFWAAAAAFSVLALGGESTTASGRLAPGVPLGLGLVAWTLLWPELAQLLGAWVPRSSQSGATLWQVAGEAAFRAAGEEPLLRGGVPWLLAPFVGALGAYGFAAFCGALLHPLPAVPLPLALAGEFVGQAALGWLAVRQGWLSAVAARGVWELLRGAFFAPAFPWQLALAFLALVAFGVLLWTGPRR